jgi:Ti-type conjugative transfer relaxase TraA
LAIAFARIQFVKRSIGQNACHKSAYCARSIVKDEQTGTTYNYSDKGDQVYHAVVLPEGANERFLDAKVLWNTAEKKERRSNSQVALEGVIALPDDACITLSDRIELAHRAAHHFFVQHGLAVQVNIHAPHGDDEDHNWHAHFLATTRTFSVGGNALGEKAREYMARYREGNLHSGEEYRAIQDAYFKEKGIDLTVDPNAIVPQEHLGPVRLRSKAMSLMRGHLGRLFANQNASLDPGKILEHLTEKQSVFKAEDVEHYLHKHVVSKEIESVRDAFWKQKDVLQLHDATSLTPHNKYTSMAVKEEEDRILRIADRLHSKSGFFGLFGNYTKGVEISDRYGLSEEQSKAYEGVVLGHKLVCVQGRAGTGKTYVMNAMREMFEHHGIRVRGLAPTSSVAKDLEKAGFEGAKNLHQFLFHQKNGIDPLRKKEVLMIDEAGMVGNAVMQEVLREAWKSGAQVVFVGDDRQIPSVDRGGMFKVFCERYGAHELKEVRRQEVLWQKELSEELSQGMTRGQLFKVLETLQDNGRIFRSPTKEDSMDALVEQWAKDRLKDPTRTSFVMEHRNKIAHQLNEKIRGVRKALGELNGPEFQCESFTGKTLIGVGDRIQFRRNDRTLGITNGICGTLVEAKETLFTVKKDDGTTVEFNPQTFNGYQLGYAGTYHQSQGKTVDLAYAMHSPTLNQNLFYVGLTRQKQDLRYYISQDEALTINDVVRQLCKDGSKETSIHYLTPKELDASKKDSFLSRALSRTWNAVKDRFITNEEFYRPKINVNEGKHYLVTRCETGPVKTIGEEQTKGPRAGVVQTDIKDLINRGLKTRSKEERSCLHQKNNQTLESIVTGLKNHLPDVCNALFQNAEPRRQGHEWRYGGSIKVNMSGPKRGVFANFETGERGGPLHLICAVNKCSMKEAIEWSKSWLAAGRSTERPSIQRDVGAIKENTLWESLIPDSKAPAPKFGEGCLTKLAAYNKETARFTYTNEKGDLLFYVIRLENEKGKMTLPLSFGKDIDEPKWALKKFKDEAKTPLYNLKELCEHPEKPVLIVEGEKTAEAAKHIFPDMVVTTWNGGAGAPHLSDWSPLKDREAIIWPDNDKVGFKAARAVESLCHDAGVKTIQTVQPENCPEKWDLADKLPSGITKDLVREKALNKLEWGREQLRLQNRTPEIRAKEEIALYRMTECNLQKAVDSLDLKNLSKHSDALQVMQRTWIKDPSIMSNIQKQDEPLFKELKTIELQLQRQNQRER